MRLLSRGCHFEKCLLLRHILHPSNGPVPHGDSPLQRDLKTPKSILKFWQHFPPSCGYLHPRRSWARLSRQQVKTCTFGSPGERQDYEPLRTQQVLASGAAARVVSRARKGQSLSTSWCVAARADETAVASRPTAGTAANSRSWDLRGERVGKEPDGRASLRATLCTWVRRRNPGLFHGGSPAGPPRADVVRGPPRWGLTSLNADPV